MFVGTHSNNKHQCQTKGTNYHLYYNSFSPSAVRKKMFEKNWLRKKWFRKKVEKKWLGRNGRLCGRRIISAVIL